MPPRPFHGFQHLQIQRFNVLGELLVGKKMALAAQACKKHAVHTRLHIGARQLAQYLVDAFHGVQHGGLVFAQVLTQHLPHLAVPIAVLNGVDGRGADAVQGPHPEGLRRALFQQAAAQLHLAHHKAVLHGKGAHLRPIGGAADGPHIRDQILVHQLEHIRVGLPKKVKMLPDGRFARVLVFREVHGKAGGHRIRLAAADRRKHAFLFGHLFFPRSRLIRYAPGRAKTILFF